MLFPIGMSLLLLAASLVGWAAFSPSIEPATLSAALLLAAVEVMAGAILLAAAWLNARSKA